MRRGHSRKLFLLCASTLLASACSDKSEGPVVPGSLTATSPTQQPGIISTNAEDPPAVILKDTRGRPMNGVSVNFTISLGAGSLQGGAAVTDADGMARVTSWTLGPIAGENTVVAVTEGLPPVVFTVTTTGPPASMRPHSAVGQVAALSSAVGSRPAVLVRDADGRGVAGVTITFAVSAGGGSITGATATTDASGAATVGSWTMGAAAGENTLTAQATGFAPLVFTAHASAAPIASGYTITVRYFAPATIEQQQAVNRAVIRWQEIIVGDLTDVSAIVPAGNCGAGSPRVDELADDVIILVDFRNIDGAGNILGQAGPCAVRSSNTLSAVGLLRLDNADLATLAAQGRMEDVILHEIGHVLGFGSIWDNLGLLQFAALDSVAFAGPRARTAFTAAGGAGFVGPIVPVENCKEGVPASCGVGTRDSHWRESVMGRELMTGFISAAGLSNPLSEITIQSMADLGYTVSTQRADAYTVAARPQVALEQESIPLQEKPPDWRIVIVDDR